MHFLYVYSLCGFTTVSCHIGCKYYEDLPKIGGNPKNIPAYLFIDFCVWPIYMVAMFINQGFTFYAWLKK